MTPALALLSAVALVAALVGLLVTRKRGATQ